MRFRSDSLMPESLASSCDRALLSLAAKRNPFSPFQHQILGGAAPVPRPAPADLRPSPSFTTSPHGSRVLGRTKQPANAYSGSRLVCGFVTGEDHVPLRARAAAAMARNAAASGPSPAEHQRPLAAGIAVRDPCREQRAQILLGRQPADIEEVCLRRQAELRRKPRRAQLLRAPPLCPHCRPRHNSRQRHVRENQAHQDTVDGLSPRSPRRQTAPAAANPSPHSRHPRRTWS